MPVNDAANISQADAGAVEFIGSMESLKDSKELVGISHIKSYPVIAYKHHCFLLARLAASDFDGGLRSRAGKFNGIADEIHKDLP
jgi:hypothetical protein